MSAPAEICDTCGKTITDEDLETGAAIAVLGKSYCPACKGEAMKEISLEDLAKPSASARPAGSTPRPADAPSRPTDPGFGKAAAKAAPSASPPPKPPAAPSKPSPDPSPAKPGAGVEIVRLELPKDLPPQSTPRTLLAPPGDRRRPPTRRAQRASKTPLLVAVGAVSLVVAILILVFPKGQNAPKKGPGPATPEHPTDPEVKGTKPTPPESREARAEKAYTQVAEVLRVPGTSPDDLLAAVERARPDCRGTPFEAKLEEVRKKAQQAKEEAEAARQLQPLYDELRRAVVTDPKFQRYAELEEKFRKAKEIALRTGSEKAAEIAEFRQDYTRRYEMAAEPYGREIGEAAQILLDEKRYDDALAKIETFPRELRQSGAWRGIERIKQEIERQRKLFPPKK